MKAKSIIAAALLVVSTMASAQAYVNVELKDGTIRSYSAESTSKVTFGENKEIGTINGHAYVELAGCKWATENVGFIKSGKTDVIYDSTYGLYYTLANDNAKQAAESWGGTWKLPSDEQWLKLMDDCNWEWITDYMFNGKVMNGFKVSDKKDSSKFIFLPAAGSCDFNNSYVLGQGERAYFWMEGVKCLELYYDSQLKYTYLLWDTKNGASVRLVSE